MARRGARPVLRLVVLLSIFCCFLLTIVVRLVQLQVVRAQPLELLGAKQRVRAIELPANRGSIYDRSMHALAVSTDARAIYVNPRLVENPERAARTLSPVIHVGRKTLLERLRRTSGFVYLARRVPPQVADQALALGIPSLGTLRETARAYPNDDLAGQLLGFVNVDNVGLSGIESRFDEVLRGKPGKQIIERDPDGRPIPQGRNSLVEPVAGKSVVLTIDRDMQFAAEQALARGARARHAAYGSAVVLDPRTGDVLAMANYPALDPNSFGTATPDERRNRAVTDVYEPGSVNKVITAAAAIELGLATPGERLRVPYSLRLANKTFHDLHPHAVEHITYAEALAESSNIATIKVAQRLGKQRLYSALRAFGLGARTGSGFPGESPGILLPPSSWYATSMGTIPIGQGIAVTPLQIASVYGTIANDGVRMPPRIVRGTVDIHGSFEPLPRVPSTRVITTYTAAKVRGMLSGVVEEGTGRHAHISGYLIGGKTGTARVPRPGGRGYSNDIITTFAGMAPADDPRFVVVVQLYNPRPRLAALTAAPIFREITAYALGRYGIGPTVPPDQADSLFRFRVRAPQPSVSPTPSVVPRVSERPDPRGKTP